MLDPTDLAGFITDAEQICQRLLNLTLRGARGKELLPFFVRNRFDIAGEMRGVLRTGVGSRRIAAESCLAIVAGRRWR